MPAFPRYPFSFLSLSFSFLLALFDLDHTILLCYSDPSWLASLLLPGFVPREAFFALAADFQPLFCEGGVNYVGCCGFTLQSLPDYSDDSISDISSDFMKVIIEPSINIYALRFIHKPSENNEELLLASGASSIVAGPVAIRLEF
jgi:hypothetical protein